MKAQLADIAWFLLTLFADVGIVLLLSVAVTTVLAFVERLKRK